MDDAKSLVLQFVEDVWNGADAEALDRLTAESYTYHLGGQPPRDRAAMLAFVKAVHAAFSDWRVTVEDTVVGEDSVAIRWTGQVTHDGPFHGIPATGKQVTVCGINLYTIQDGRIAKEYEQMDSLSMLTQMGVLPPAK